MSGAAIDSRYRPSVVNDFTRIGRLQFAGFRSGMKILWNSQFPVLVNSLHSAERVSFRQIWTLAVSTITVF